MRETLRQFRRNPGYAAFYVAILTLGIGVNAALFGVLNALVFRPLAVRDAGRLVQLSTVYRTRANVPFSYPAYKEIARRQRVLSSLIAWGASIDTTVEAGGTMLQSGVRSVTGNYFAELEAVPTLGRLIQPRDANGTALAVLSHAYWMRRFAGNPGVIGRTLRIDGRSFTIIGVTARHFMGITPGDVPDITVPVGSEGRDLRDRRLLWMSLAGRLAEGVTIEQARAQLRTAWPAILEASVPLESTGERRRSFLSMGLGLDSARSGAGRESRVQLMRPVLLLLAIAAALLLIMCLNLANLSAARAAARAREVSVRLALGSGAGRIIRQSFTESLLLACAGAACAVVISSWGSRFVLHLIGTEARAPLTLDVQPDWRVLAFAAVLALAAAAIIGLAPVVQILRQSPALVLRRVGGLTGRESRWGRRAMVAAQIALSFLLLECAGLCLRTLESLRAVDAGFSREGLTEAALHCQPGACEQASPMSYRRQLLTDTAGLPGVRAAAYSSAPIPAGELGWRESVALTSGGRDVMATLVVVSPEYFRTLGVALREGREFTWADDASRKPVAILDSETARALIPAGQRVGAHVRFGVQPAFQDIEVVGVAPHMALLDSREPRAAVLFVPAAQFADFAGSGVVLVREQHGGQAASALAALVRSRGVEYVGRIDSVLEQSEQALARERVIAQLSACSAVGAMLLAGLGLFATMSYMVSRRTREIGIRMALGSDSRAVRRLILRECLLLAVAGIALGWPCASMVRQAVSHLVFQLPGADTLLLAAAALLLIASSLAAGYLPARRATRVDVTNALRAE